MLQSDERTVHQGVVHRVFVESRIPLPEMLFASGDYTGDGFFHGFMERFHIPELGKRSPKWWNNLHQHIVPGYRCFLLPVWLDNQGTFREELNMSIFDPSAVVDTKTLDVLNLNRITWKEFDELSAVDPDQLWFIQSSTQSPIVVDTTPRATKLSQL